ncbi:MAG: YjjG family noncanonical pyrimidine nucleotidase [Thermoanaerobaculia bacterium]|nr:YjjG family noncanonical pyrimidine nucleotidase [Thermoanaerobaculia bacterium]
MLLDADGTLFDYDRAEAAALAATWEELGLPREERLLPAYREINHRLWRSYERGEIEQAAIPGERFARLLTALGHDADAGRASSLYLRALARQTHLLDGALRVVSRLARRAELALVTNGLAEVQRPRLAASPLAPFFEVVVISGEIGAGKPDPAFFDAAFRRMGDPPRRQTLIVGDSLTSDIEGGRRYGIDTCWLNPRGAEGDGRPLTYEIRELAQLERLV